MNSRPITFGDLIRRLAPESPDDASGNPPLVASAVELDRPQGPRGRAFWVILHSVTDHDMKLLHARPMRAANLSIRIQAESGEVVRTLVTVAESHPKGDLYETTASFQRVGLDIGRVA
jgi:hypothetical protein